MRDSWDVKHYTLNTDGRGAGCRYGRNALKKLLTTTSFEQQPPPGVDLAAVVKGSPMEDFPVVEIHSSLTVALKQIGLLDEGPGGNVPVTKFLNRLLGAPVSTLFICILMTFRRTVMGGEALLLNQYTPLHIQSQ